MAQLSSHIGRSFLINLLCLCVLSFRREFWSRGAASFALDRSPLPLHGSGRTETKTPSSAQTKRRGTAVFARPNARITARNDRKDAALSGTENGHRCCADFARTRGGLSVSHGVHPEEPRRNEDVLSIRQTAVGDRRQSSARETAETTNGPLGRYASR